VATLGQWDGRIGSVVKVYLKYDAALHDREPPGMYVATPPGTPSAIALARFLDFGIPTDPMEVTDFELRIPGVELPATPSPTLSLGAFEPLDPADGPVAWTVHLIDDAQDRLGELLFVMRQQARGPRGGVALSGSDLSGTVDLMVAGIIDGAELRCTASFTVKPVAGATARSVVDALAFAYHLTNAASFEIRDRNGQFVLSPVPMPPDTDRPGDEFEFLYQLARDLLTLERLVAPALLRMPQGQTREDLAAVTDAASLVRGETVEGSWESLNLDVNPESDPALREHLASSRAFATKAR